jgi:hypothetical protein
MIVAPAGTLRMSPPFFWSISLAVFILYRLSKGVEKKRPQQMDPILTNPVAAIDNTEF